MSDLSLKVCRIKEKKEITGDLLGEMIRKPES